MTSTTYVTIPARSTTTAAPRPDNEEGSGDGGGEAEPEDANPESSTPADPNQERIHEIESGDFLYGIASDYDMTADDIVAYNGWTDGVRHALVPGQTIRIPPADWQPEDERGAASTDENAGSAPDSSSDDGCDTYRIRQGDTKGRVAAAHDVTVAELDAANASTQFYAGFVIGIDIQIPC